MKLKVSNFQSISDASLEFPIGITLVVGPSNSGKTSLIRAIYSLLTNTSEAKNFIKHETDKSRVTLELEGFPKLTWTRTLKDATYEIDDVVHQKVGKVDLFDLVPNNGFYQDDTSSDILNIQDEWSTLFPFDRNSSQMYKLFEELFSINDATEVMTNIKNDDLTLRKELVDLDKKVIKNSEKINSSTDFTPSQPID